MTDKRQAYYDRCRKQRQRIVQLLEQSKSYGEIAKELGCSYDLVSKTATQHNLTHQHKLKSMLAILKPLLTTTDTLTAIADRLKVSRDKVQHVYNEARTVGLDLPERKRGRPRK